MFEDFIGQSKLILELESIRDGLIRDKYRSLNLLFRGTAGCGKTLLARSFCKSFNKRYSYQVANKQVHMTDNIKDCRFHVIDEAHMITDFETVYSLMDSGNYVIIFCTTDYGVLPEPFTSRCLQFFFEDYSIKDLATIITDYAKREGFVITMDTAILIAEKARGSPRIAKAFAIRIKFMVDAGRYPKTIDGISDAFLAMGIHRGGYTDLDKKYLEFLQEVGKASLSMISRTIGVDEQTIKNDLEPFLVNKGHIVISARGRTYINGDN